MCDSYAHKMRTAGVECIFYISYSCQEPGVWVFTAVSLLVRHGKFQSTSFEVHLLIDSFYHLHVSCIYHALNTRQGDKTIKVNWLVGRISSEVNLTAEIRSVHVGTTEERATSIHWGRQDRIWQGLQRQSSVFQKGDMLEILETLKSMQKGPKSSRYVTYRDWD